MKRNIPEAHFPAFLKAYKLTLVGEDLFQNTTWAGKAYKQKTPKGVIYTVELLSRFIPERDEHLFN